MGVIWYELCTLILRRVVHYTSMFWQEQLAREAALTAIRRVLSSPPTVLGGDSSVLEPFGRINVTSADFQAATSSIPGLTNSLRDLRRFQHAFNEEICLSDAAFDDPDTTESAGGSHNGDAT